MADDLVLLPALLMVHGPIKNRPQHPASNLKDRHVKHNLFVQMGTPWHRAADIHQQTVAAFQWVDSRNRYNPYPYRRSPGLARRRHPCASFCRDLGIDLHILAVFDRQPVYLRRK